MIRLPNGFYASGVRAGLKRKGADLAFISIPDGANAAAIFTTNRFQAAPVLLSSAALKKSRGRVRAVVINAGCANAITGIAGTQAAERVRDRAAAIASCPAHEVFVASTGVIGRVLPDDKISAALPDAWARLSVDGLASASVAITTTDLGPKVAETSFKVGGKRARVVGFAKGAGMIHPNMATMLGFVMTDASLSPAQLKKALVAAADESFHAISVDGDTSTNDTVLALSSGKLKGAVDLASFGESLTDVCKQLAWMIVRDGEGATRVLDVTVTGAKTARDAALAVHAVATSPLVKTALNGGDPNWGRILAAVGRSGARFQQARVSLKVGALKLVNKGTPVAYREADAAAIFSRELVPVTVELGAGTARAHRMSCDLGHDYVTCNADYRT